MLKAILCFALIVLMVRIGLPSIPQQNVEKFSKPQAVAGESAPEEKEKKKFPWLAIVALILVAVGAGYLASCSKTPTTPNPPEPEPTMWTLKIYYTRTEIRSPGYINKVVSTTITGRVFLSEQITKIDDTHYVHQFSGVPSTEGYGVKYSIWADDLARWDRTDCGTRIVGDKFVIEVVETGFSKELLNVTTNDDERNPCRTPSAKKSGFDLLRDGTFTDY